MRLLVAFRAFFAALFSGDASRRIDRALLEGPASAPAKRASLATNNPIDPSQCLHPRPPASCRRLNVAML